MLQFDLLLLEKNLKLVSIALLEHRMSECPRYSHPLLLFGRGLSLAFGAGGTLLLGTLLSLHGCLKELFLLLIVILKFISDETPNQFLIFKSK